jgi:copper ion binding protein
MELGVTESGKDKSVSTFAVEGLTCASCVGTVEGALKQLTGVEKVQVALVTERAEVTYDPSVLQMKDILNAIEDPGYGAEHLSTKNIAAPKAVAKLLPAAQQTTSTFAIEGLTCASCVSSCEGALNKLAGIKKVQIALVTERGEVTYDAGVLPMQDIMSAIEDIGYGAQHVGTVIEAVKQRAADKAVSVVTIEGMTCSSCSSSVEGALNKLEGVEKAQVALVTERAEVTYDPSVVTLQDVMGAIEDIGYGAEHVSTEAIKQAGGGGPQLSVATFSIEGMTCAACVGTVEGVLNGHGGVEKAQVALLTEKAEVTFDAAQTDAGAIADSIEAVGFGAQHLGTQVLAMDDDDQDREETRKMWAVYDVKALVDGRDQGSETARDYLMAQRGRGVVKVYFEEGEGAYKQGFRVVVEYEVQLSGDMGAAAAAAGAAAAAVAAQAEGSTSADSAEAAAQAAHEAATEAAGGIVGIGVRDMLEMLQAVLPQASIGFVGGGQGWGCCLTPGGGVPGGDDAVNGQTSNDRRLLRTIRKQRRDLLLAAMLTLPIFLVTMIGSLSADLPWLRQGPHKAVVQWLLSTGVQFAPGCGLKFYKETWAGLRHRNFGMSFLVCMGTSAAYGFAVFAAVQYLVIWNANAGTPGWSLADEQPLIVHMCEHGPDNFLTSAMLITFISGGKYLEIVAKGRTSSALSKLAQLQAKTAVLLERVPIISADVREQMAAETNVGRRSSFLVPSKNTPPITPAAAAGPAISPAQRRASTVSAAQRRALEAKTDAAKYHVKDATARDSFPQAELDAFKLLFQQIDEDNSGEIEEGELENLMAACGETQMTGRRLSDMMAAIDLDQSGTVCFSEFVRMMYDVREGRHAQFGAALGRAVATHQGKADRHFMQVIERVIPVELVQLGDELKVVRGGAVPADGYLLSGTAQIDESMLTGESVPQRKAAGDQLMCATTMTEGLCTMRVTGIGADTALAQIVSLVSAAQVRQRGSPPLPPCPILTTTTTTTTNNTL